MDSYSLWIGFFFANKAMRIRPMHFIFSLIRSHMRENENNFKQMLDLVFCE